MAQIIDFAPERAENPYTQDIADLIAAGEGKAALFVAEYDGVKGKATDGIVRRLVTEAARDAGFTARYRKTEAQPNGDVHLIVTLGKLRTRTVKPAEPTETDTPEAPVADKPAKGK